MGHHAGDLPNLEVGADGKVDVIMNAPQTSLKKGADSACSTGTEARSSFMNIRTII